jgi:hypothetical protein
MAPSRSAHFQTISFGSHRGARNSHHRQGCSSLSHPATTPCFHASFVQPDLLPLDADPARQQAVAWSIHGATDDAASLGRRGHRISVQPFRKARLVGTPLGLRPVELAIVFSDGCPLIEVCLPVLCRPPGWGLWRWVGDASGAGNVGGGAGTAAPAGAGGRLSSDPVACRCSTMAALCRAGGAGGDGSARSNGGRRLHPRAGVNGARWAQTHAPTLLR